MIRPAGRRRAATIWLIRKMGRRTWWLAKDTQRGFNQGQADASRGKKFKPTDSDAYEHAKVPNGFNKDEFKQTFHEAFVKGYSNGYKG